MPAGDAGSWELSISLTKTPGETNLKFLTDIRWILLLNEHSYKEFANEDNAVLVKSNGKIDCDDGKFFIKGNSFNQGQMFSWDEDDFIDGCEEAIKRFQSSPKNEAGVKLQEAFSLSKTVDALLDHIEDL